MTIPIHKLDCKNGCQADRLKFLFEQYALDMDDMMNNLQTDHIDLCNIISEVVLPYLEYHANRGDEEARALTIELNPFI